MPASRDSALLEITQLAISLQTLKEKGQEPFVLYVGTQAPLSKSGRPALEELEQTVLLEKSMAHQAALDGFGRTRQERFQREWARLSDLERRAFLMRVFETLPISEGYKALAAILKAGFLRLVVTSNLDSLIETALGEVLLPGQWSRLVNGYDSPDRVQSVLADRSYSVVVLKLCGDLSMGPFALEAGAIGELMRPLESILNPYLSRPLIVVGYGPLDDYIVPYLPKRGDRVYYVGTVSPHEGSPFFECLWQRRRTDIVDETMNFNLFCTCLAQELHILPKPKGPAEAGTVSERLVEIIPPDVPEDFSSLQPGETPGNTLVELVRPTVFTIRVDARYRVSFDVTGAVNYTSEAAEEWRVNVDDLNVLLQDMGRDIAAYHRLGDQEGRDSWRRRAKREGQRLYEDLMAASPDLSRKLELARQAVEPPENLTLAFSGPRHHLGMPYELLHDGKVPLAVRHPLCRQVSGVTVRHTQNLDAFVRALRRKNEPLRLLLIASDTGGLAVDEEVEVIRHKARQARLNLSIDCLLTNEASLGEVERRLRQCSYHLVHYAGHGHFDPATGENSGLLFWRDRNRRGGTALLTARQLAQLLAGGQTMLFYLSTCVGAQVGSEQLLRDNDYLGVMDAVVQAGVPYVLGYRWYVTDSGSRRFAFHFYERLFTSPYVPEQAILHARSQVYGADGTDETWTSPILVAQNLYR